MCYDTPMKSSSGSPKRPHSGLHKPTHKSPYKLSNKGVFGAKNGSKGGSREGFSRVGKGQGGGTSTITGVISTTAKGAGYIDSADKKAESTYIEAGFLNTALNGDTVEVRVHKNGSAEVVKVISRARTKFVGKTVQENGEFILTLDDRKAYTSMVLQPTTEQKSLLKNDLKILARLLPWSDPKQKPRGEIIRILGEKGDNNVEMESIVLESGFETGFPDDVEKEAKDIQTKQSVISTEEIARRKDMRDVPTFTIDPFDAKDFDDAISFRQLSENEVAATKTAGPLYEIGVHIADVSHYVREGTALDREALKRGCSVYLVDRTIPMLPEELSNDLCSLKPNEDRLAFSAVFVVDDNARVHSRWFGRTVIHSIHRFTYETAQAVIDNDASLVQTYSAGIQTKESAEAGMKYRDTLLILNRIGKMFMKDKFSKGAIEFEQDEVKFRLDEKGKPIGVYTKQRLDTHKLVEEYMLLANREVAAFTFHSDKKKGIKDSGAIYRIHDAPDKDRIKDLAFFVKALGYNLSTEDGVVTARALNDLLDQIEDTPHESLIRTAAVRSMQKAVYSTKNVGHFGLAFKFYTHFTSPIRRYPDVLVHRILDRHLNSGAQTSKVPSNASQGSFDATVLQRMAESSTRREIDAAGAERSSVKLKQVEYMAGHIGETFKGTISGVTKWGLYVEDKETKSEGMIHISELGSDYFNFDEKTYSIVGEKTKKKFTLGDEITFKVVSADLDKKMLSCALG